MKKSRLCSILLAAALSAGLCVLPAAASGAVPAAPAPSEESRAASFSPSAGADSGSAILEGMSIQAEAAILVDTDYDAVLYEQNAHDKMYPASITKVMTALLVLEAVDQGGLTMDQVITAGSDVFTGIGEGGSTADIKPGEQLTVRDLLNCALISSANEACNALATAVSGDIASFVAQMNQRAAELGMEDTHFTNTHGYHDDDHYTTAYDIALMCKQAMEHEEFRKIVSSKNYTVPATNLHAERIVRDTNALISNFRITGYLYEYANGIKTGSTPEAGYCLASSAERDGKHLIAVVLGAENPTVDGKLQRLQFSESARLLDWGFHNFSYRTILDDTKLDIAEVEVTLSQEANYVAVHPEGEIAACLPNDLDPTDFTFSWTLDAQSVEAPVEKGQVLGSITVTHGNVEYGTLPLVANARVERSVLLYRLDRIQKFFDQLWVKLVLLAVLLLVVVLLLRRIFFRGRGGRRRGGYTYSGRSRYSGRRRR